MHKGAIFPLFYLPPIELFSRIKQGHGDILIEQFEHFPKQTYRNRALIHSPQGKLALIVPVVKGSKVHTKVKDVQISYDFDWQRLHWMSIQTSYRSSAYFEFYESDFSVFYEKRWKYLYEYNEEIFQLLTKLLKLDIQWSFTQAFEKQYDDYADYRESIHPKKVSDIPFQPYFQVFEDRNGFIPNLSIIDLLFNQGPRSASLF
ncbi:WbqC family protein [Pararcticibacter amylolyticus]|uniref:WbqC family protein n=1 Tax=Pararcticibacter amylolyticus TaxID=2173175 RepID=A0A2U2PGB4_9SPHI|nr:WbqC family protein [Pararcticibacter amylolyticus]PWG80448.1 hypothetical protein DDR33_12675 [Pararcticibacter amylolyticus]